MKQNPYKRKGASRGRSQFLTTTPQVYRSRYSMFTLEELHAEKERLTYLPSPQHNADIIKRWRRQQIAELNGWIKHRNESMQQRNNNA